MPAPSRLSRLRDGAVLLCALLLAGCTTGGLPVAPSPTETATAFPEPSGTASPTPTATAGEPRYYTFDGSWERFRVAGYFCTEGDEVFIGSPQGVTGEFQDPGFSFFRNGTVFVSGSRESGLGTFQGFGGEGTWDFLIALDGRPVAIYGSIDAGYRIEGTGPGSAVEFSADLDIDVTPGYDDPLLVEGCQG